MCGYFWNLNNLNCIVIYKIKKTKITYIFKKTLSRFIVYSKYAHEYKTIFKEEGSTEMFKILGLINNIEGYQKIHNHAWRKHESRT